MFRSRMKLIAKWSISALAIAGCGSTQGAVGSTPGANGSTLPQGGEHVAIDPAQFSTEIDNPYFPMSPGSKWVYREAENGTRQRVEVTVTPKKKVIDGVTTRAVHDLVTRRGARVEDTIDYYAQDTAGNIWYFGEDTAEYDHGKLSSRAGSFHAGVDGAEPGVAVPVDPQQGMSYRQEYYAGHAEDNGEVLSTTAQVESPYGHFDNALMTSDTNPLEPRGQEFKLYAKGVGPVMELLVSGGSGRTVLVSHRR